LIQKSGGSPSARQRFVGITTVFEGDGTYLLSNVSRECNYDDYAETRSTQPILDARLPVVTPSDDRDKNVMKGVLAPTRGTIARIGRWTRLVAVNSHSLIKRANSPLPKPVLVNLHQDSTFLDLDYLAEQVLKFTALSWRSTLPAETPVTIYYSELIAELLAQLRQVPDWSATALSIRLRWSRWFL
jgi:hypothetical protein